MKGEGLPSANVFALQIEELVWNKDVSYMDAVVIWCEERGLEPEIGATLVKRTAPIKSKIQCEAEDLNLLPKNGEGKLPI